MLRRTDWGSLFWSERTHIGSSPGVAGVKPVANYGKRGYFNVAQKLLYIKDRNSNDGNSKAEQELFKIKFKVYFIGGKEYEKRKPIWNPQSNLP